MVRPNITRRLLTGMSALALAFAGIILVASPAAAALLSATTEAELITAINTANTDAATDTITLGANITLTASLPAITENLEVVGAGFSINGGNFTVFHDTGAAANINLEFSAVSVINASYAINTNFSNVTITDSSFDDATVYIYGSGITVDITDSFFENAQNDGLYLSASDSSSVSMSGSSASGNLNDGFDLNVQTDSIVTVTDCAAASNGGDGLAVDTEDHSTGTVTQSSGNNNSDSGFDIDASDNSTITMTDSSANTNANRGFDTNASTVSSIIITGATAAMNVNDGAYALAESSSTISVSDSQFIGNDYGIIAKPHAGSTITVHRVTVDGNDTGGVRVDDDADAGSQNTVTISESTLSDNSGSGLEITSTTFTDTTVDRTTISGNSNFNGSGIYAELYGSSSLSLSNSTVSGNDQATEGAIGVPDFSDTTASIRISHSTIVNNSSGFSGQSGGVFIGAVQYSISNSILAGNTSNGAPLDLDLGAVIPPTGSINHSLVQASSANALGAVDAGTGNLKNMSAMLGPLSDNGGPTLTHLPLDGSPVINAGDPGITRAPATDQRGQTRVMATIDMGAVEVQIALATTGSDSMLPLTGAALLLLTVGGLLVLLRKRHTAH